VSSPGGPTSPGRSPARTRGRLPDTGFSRLPPPPAGPAGQGAAIPALQGMNPAAPGAMPHGQSPACRVKWRNRSKAGRINGRSAGESGSFRVETARRRPRGQMRQCPNAFAAIMVMATATFRLPHLPSRQLNACRATPDPPGSAMRPGLPGGQGRPGSRH